MSLEETKIFVDTSHGRVLHGTLTGTVFQRRLNSNGIRHSDKSLPLNPQCIAQLWALGCDTIEFTVDYVGSTIKYSIPYENAIKCERKVNEYGDVDIRIPLKEFKQEVIDIKTISDSQRWKSSYAIMEVSKQPMLFEEFISDAETKNKTKSKKIDRCPY